MRTRILLPEDVQARIANVAHDFHVNLDTLTERQYLALARECGYTGKEDGR